MNKSFKKVASVALTFSTAVYLFGAAAIPAGAQSTADLAAQIAALLAQIQTLQAQLAAQSGGGAVASSYSFTRNLTVGSTGADVKALQQWLNANGYTVSASGAGSVGNETQYFGPATRAALAKYQAAVGISPAAGYFGPITRARVSAAGGSTTPGAPVVPGTGLAVSLAGDNPVAKVLPKGAAGVEMLKFNIAGSGTVNNITIKRVGAGQTSDFSSVYLYSGDTRLTSGRTINSSSHEANFTGVNLAVNGVTTLRVVADVATGAGQGDYNGFQVQAVDATVAVSGIPTVGNQFSISGTSSGTVTATDQSDGLSNPSVGQSNAEVFRFKLTTANEDMKVSRISVFYAGALSKSNVSNFVLKDLLSGNTLATAASINSKDMIVFGLATPYEIKKGDNRQFSVYADIAAGARSGTSETLIFYFEEGSDIYAVGSQYGFGATVTVTDIDSASDYRTNSALSLQTGTFVISFLGPSTGDIAKNAKDITLYDFTVSTANNIEVRNMRFTVTASTTQAGVDDFKLVDVDSGLVVSGPTDDATGSVVMTDDFTIPAGVKKHYRVTGDTDTNWLNNETIKVDLAAFTAASDLKNVDSNTFLANADVVPNGAAGNTLTVKSPTLVVSAASLPASDSFVKGTQNVPFLGVSLRASADAIKVTSIKVTTSATSGSTSEMATDVTSVALYDGAGSSATRISDIKSWSTSGATRTITFSNLDYTIAQGDTKTVVVKANISSSATSSNRYAVIVADTSTDITALDSDGNSPTMSGASASGPVVTILSGGTVTVARAADDTESKAGVVVASASTASPNRVVLGKFDFTAASEDMTVNKLNLHVDNDATSSTNSTAPLDDIIAVYLYDGSTPIGATNGYSADPTTGTVTIEGLGWLIPKDTTKKLTVKADLNSITAGADTGDEIYVQVIESAFEANGAVTTATSLSGAPIASNQKVLYKSYPSISTATISSTSLTSLSGVEVARFRVAANSADVEWASVGFELSLSNASATDGAFTIDRVSPFASLTVATQTPNSSAFDLTGGTAQSVIIQLTTPEQITSGGYYEYVVKLTATALQFGTAQEAETLTTKIVLHNDSSTANLANAVDRQTAQNASTTLGANGVINSSDNAFVWSDRAVVGHSLTSSDWANGVYVVEPASLSSFVITR